jgi:peptidoglycan/LPS O-acetylase OafA/YrhL
LATERLRVRVGSWSIHPTWTDLFDHLWFLWFLCWFTAVFAGLAAGGCLPSGHARPWLVAFSCLPQVVMGMAPAGSYGPDTSYGIIPQPHILGYYGCFFFFGVATFAAEGIDTRLGRHFRLYLPAAVGFFVAGIATMNDRLLATVLQPGFAWTMSLGLMGLFHRFVAKPAPAVTWLADASYWMYLVHVPLVIVSQWLVRSWPLPASLKAVLILAVVTPLLLASYARCVRGTVIGRLLNGPRESPLDGPSR